MSRKSFSLLLPLVLLVACEEPIQVQPTEVRPVRYARVVAQGNMEQRTYSGTARAELETDLSFKVAGTLLSRDANVGDTLVPGSLVGTLEDTDYRVKLQESAAGLARAQAEVRNAEASYDRTRELYENRNASRSDLDSSRAGAESARAQVRAASQQLEAARLQLSYTRLTAPQECSVAEVFAQVNQNLSAGQSVIRVNCGQCAEVVVGVPEVDIGRITQGTVVQVAMDAVPDRSLIGVVTEVGVSSGGTTYPVTIALQDGCAAVRSGMAADVLFRFPTIGPTGGLVVPSVSVGEDSSGRFVFVLEPAGEDSIWLAVRRGVEVAGPIGQGLLIGAGLNEGELIATAGVRRLVDGQRVTLLGDGVAP